MLKLPSDYATVKADCVPELIEFIDKFALKHITVPVEFEVSFEQHRANPVKGKHIYLAKFVDTRLNAPVGEVAWDYGNSASSYEYVVTSRLIENDKYARWNTRDHKSVRTKDVRKAVKNAMEYLLPVGISEILGKSQREAFSEHSTWQQALRGCMPSLSDKEWVEELENLVAQNVVFKTPAFKLAVQAIPRYKEHLERNKKESPKTSVLYAFGKVYVNDREYPNHDELPQHIKERVGVLKLMEDKHFVPEVGYKVDSNSFWIYNESNN